MAYGMPGVDALTKIIYIYIYMCVCVNFISIFCE